MPAGPDDAAPTHLTLLPWPDPVIDDMGHDPRSDYVERFWLGVIGPSCTWFLRRLSLGFDAEPDGFELDVAECARALGLGAGLGRNAPLGRTITRCCQFGLTRRFGRDRLAVRRRLPPLARHHLARLPEALQDEHARWTGLSGGPAARPAARPAATGCDDRGGTRAGAGRAGPSDVGGRGRTAGAGAPAWRTGCGRGAALTDRLGRPARAGPGRGRVGGRSAAGRCGARRLSPAAAPDLPSGLRSAGRAPLRRCRVRGRSTRDRLRRWRGAARRAGAGAGRSAPPPARRWRWRA